MTRLGAATASRLTYLPQLTHTCPHSTPACLPLRSPHTSVPCRALSLAMQSLQRSSSRICWRTRSWRSTMVLYNNDSEGCRWIAVSVSREGRDGHWANYIRRCVPVPLHVFGRIVMCHHRVCVCDCVHALADLHPSAASGHPAFRVWPPLHTLPLCLTTCILQLLFANLYSASGHFQSDEQLQMDMCTRTPLLMPFLSPPLPRSKGVLQVCPHTAHA